MKFAFDKSTESNRWLQQPGR